MTERSPLTNQCIAICGRLASMTHAAAAQQIAALGGRHVRTVNESTDLLVVGDHGFPLTDSGELDPRARHARDLNENGAEIRIIGEREFLGLLHPSGSDDRVRRRYTIAELSALIGVPRHVIRGWMRHGLLVPVETVHRAHYFDFSQVSRLRTLAELAENGVSATSIKGALRQLSCWLGEPNPLDLFAAMESRRRRLVVRLPDGRLAEAAGQLLMDFQEKPVACEDLIGLPTAPLFERALAYEDAGELELAAAVYREILERGDEDPETRFNLANVVYALGQIDASIELFEQALDRDPEYVEAWNNLGSVLVEAGRCEDALSAFHRAIEIRPSYADAHFNLATTLDERGQGEEARPHWLAYLDLDNSARRSNRVRTRRLTTASRNHEDDEHSAILPFDPRRADRS